MVTADSVVAVVATVNSVAEAGFTEDGDLDTAAGAAIRGLCTITAGRTIITIIPRTLIRMCRHIRIPHRQRIPVHNQWRQHPPYKIHQPNQPVKINP